MEHKYYVYQLRIEGENMPFYVGKGCGPRYKVHLMPSSLKVNSHKNNVIKKALASGRAVITEFIEESLAQYDAYLLEAFYVSAYGRVVNGGILTNGTDGGDGGYGRIVTAEERLKLSIAHTGKTKHTPESKKKLSEFHKGVPSKITDEGRKRISESSRNRVMLPETRAKLSASKKGVPQPPEAVLRMIQTQIDGKKSQGVNNAQAKLTEDDIIHAYILFQEGMTGKAVAQIIGVAEGTIYNIKNGGTWSHLHKKHIRSI